MTRILLILIMVAMASVLPAQTRQPWEEYLAQTGLAEDVESADLEARYDDLCELAANRMNLNTARREDMERLPLPIATVWGPYAPGMSCAWLA